MKCEGGCLCGAFRYEFDRDKVISAHTCYCQDCQKSTGSGSTTFVVLSEEAVQTLSGDLKSHATVGEDGSTITRAFCPECGSPIWSYCSQYPGMVYVKAGSMDDSDWVTVASGFWRSSARPWAMPDGSYPVCEKNS